MVDAVRADAGQINALVVGGGEVADQSLLTQLNVLTIGIYPSKFGQLGQLDAYIPLNANMDAEVSQLDVLIVGAGRISNPSLKVSTFTLDGHDFYVLYLGNEETLLYDVYSKRWVNWGNHTSARWRNRTITNWPGATGVSPGTPIIAGDDTFGTLYFLDPDYPYDDHPSTGPANRATFHRIAQGQVPHRGRDPVDCYGVELTGSFGDVYDISLTGVTLSYSDDAGRSYVDAGTLEIPVGDYAARIEWPSLGMINSPGRLFKIEDDGALARIDSLDMDTPDAGS